MSDGELRIAACPRLIASLDVGAGGGGGAGAGAGVGAGGGGGAEAGVLRRSVSVPWTGPRHVVPEYGTVRVSGSTIVPVPLSEKLHDGIPGRVAVPLAVIGTVEPLS